MWPIALENKFGVNIHLSEHTRLTTDTELWLMLGNHHGVSAMKDLADLDLTETVEGRWLAVSRIPVANVPRWSGSTLEAIMKRQCHRSADEGGIQFVIIGCRQEGGWISLFTDRHAVLSKESSLLCLDHHYRMLQDVMAEEQMRDMQ